MFNTRYRLAGNVALAIEYYKKYLEMEPGDAAARIKLNTLTGQKGSRCTDLMTGDKK